MANQDGDYPAQIADLIESLAVKIRSLTVDRAERSITWAAFGLLFGAIGGARR